MTDEEQRAKNREYKRRYKERHPERFKAKSAEYKLRYKAKDLDRFREQQKQQNQRKHAKNRVNENAASKAAYERSREERKRYARDQYIANKQRMQCDPGFAAKYSSQRRAIKLRALAKQRAAALVKRSAWQVERQCDNCGSTFTIGRRNQRFCSPSCCRIFSSRFQGIARNRVGARKSCMTPDEWRALLSYFGWRCAYCSKPSKNLEMDHVDPLVRGGPHAKDNIVPACKSCNSSKHAQNLIEFMVLRPRFGPIPRASYERSGMWQEDYSRVINPAVVVG